MKDLLASNDRIPFLSLANYWTECKLVDKSRTWGINFFLKLNVWDEVESIPKPVLRIGSDWPSPTTVVLGPWFKLWRVNANMSRVGDIGKCCDWKIYQNVPSYD